MMFGLSLAEQHFWAVVAFVIWNLLVLIWEKIIGNATWTRAASTLDLIKLGVFKLLGKKQQTELVLKDGSPTGDIKNGTL